MNLAGIQLPRSAHLTPSYCVKRIWKSRSFHKFSRVPARRWKNPGKMGSEGPDTDYSAWSNQDLIRRVTELERKLKEQNANFPPVAQTPAQPPLAPPQSSPEAESQPLPYRKPPKKAPAPFDPSKYTTRPIALKFAYLGQAYNGFEHHPNNSTPLPTIEEEIWKALVKTKLIFPQSKPRVDSPEAKEDTTKQEGQWWEREEADVNWEGCEYSKCGRTDRGVSAFGQVIGVRVRSNQRARPPAPPQPADAATNSEHETISQAPVEQDDSFDPITSELPYIQLLNRVLPPDIRILAWCPHPPPNFSARFSCKERRYKYFFTNPSFSPVPGSGGLFTTRSEDGTRVENREGWLDIEAMRKACKNLEGLHDFRNFCKLDASKQITNFQRRIFHADIEEISPLSLPSYLSHPSLLPPTPSDAPSPKLYAIVIHGSAFLWHQVRSIAALLFLVGQRLEPPSLIPALLDTASNPRKPKYEMATDAPLVLWDCIFPSPDEVESTETRVHGYKDSLEWIYVGEKGGTEGGVEKGVKGKGMWGRGGIVDDVWEVWRRRKVDEVLAGELLDVVVGLGGAGLRGGEVEEVNGKERNKSAGARVFDGGDVARLKGNYIPVLKKERMEAVEVINERYARKKGWDPVSLRVKDQDIDE